MINVKMELQRIAKDESHGDKTIDIFGSNRGTEIQSTSRRIANTHKRNNCIAKLMVGNTNS